MERVLLGRQRLLRRAVDHLERDGGVVLAGLPWVGRTRLLREALARVDAEHVLIRATRSGADTPFGNLGRIAPRDPDRPDRWLDQLREQLPTPDAVVAVDGAQFLDDRSGLLLLQAAEERAVRLAITVWRSHPAPDAVMSLWTDGLLPRLEVEPFDRESSDDLVRHALGGAVEEATLLQLWDTCRGYPLLIREYVDGSLAAGRLVQVDGLWAARHRLVHTPSLVDTARQVREGLGAEAVDAVDLLSIAEPLPPAVADRLVAPDVLDRLERWDLFVPDQTGRYRLPAPGWAESLRAGLTAVARRRIVRRLAEAVPPLTELQGDELVRAARWRQEAALPVAGDQLLRGARAARDLGRTADAAALAEPAAAHDPVGARMVLADAHARGGRADDAVQLLMEAAELSPDHTVAARALVMAARLEYFRAGRAEAAVQLLHDGVARTEDPEAQAIVHAELGLLHGLRGDLERALQMAAPVAADETRTPALRFSACRAATVAAMWTGRLTQARRFLAAGRVAAAELPQGVGLLGAAVSLEFCEPVVLLASGRPRQAIDRCEAGYRSALAAGATANAAVWALQTALGAVPVGELELAARRAGEAVALSERDDEHAVLALAWGARALAAIAVGDAATARRGLARLDASRQGVDARAGIVRSHVVAGLRALDGDLAGAARSVAAAAREAADAGQAYWAADLFHAAVRYGYPELVVDPLAAVAAGMEGPLAPLWARHARALADGQADALERVADDFLDQGFTVWGTEALVQAVGLHTRAGLTGRGRVLRARAGVLLEELSGLRTPAVHGFGTEPLTRREREVAMLAAEGRTSPEIAGQLVVSVRTVDNHLASIYRKLGISGRGELAHVLLGS